MGLIPATGSAITMGRVRNAYGLTGAARMRADLAVAVKNSANYSYETAINWSTGALQLSAGFGGRTSPNTY